MKLEGSLDAFSLPDIFQLLSFTKKSGGLRLSNGSAVGVVYVSEGLVTGATADGSRQALARRLIGSGVVDDATLERAVAAAQEGTGVGRALLESGAVDAELVREAATEQTVDSVFDLLRWPGGDFVFNVDTVNPDDVGVRLATDVVVGEATQRQAAWESVASVIPGPDTLLVMPVVLGVEPAVTRDEWALLALVDGRRRVGDLVELTGCGQYAVVSTLAGLVTRGLLQAPDAEDHVSVVLRRQGMLAELERRTPAPLPPAEDLDAAAQDLDESPESSEPPRSERQPEPQPAAAEPTHEASAPGEVVQLVGAARAAAVVDGPGADAVPEVATEQDEPGPRPVPMAPAAENRPPAPLLGRAHVPGDVVPPRPEPFLPSRKPDHPEAAPAARLTGLPSVGQQVVGATAVAAEADPAGLIERDPSVNRSLLLRLIAGVRGL